VRVLDVDRENQFRVLVDVEFFEEGTVGPISLEKIGDKEGRKEVASDDVSSFSNDFLVVNVDH
jgi:hypothetical protein